MLECFPSSNTAKERFIGIPTKKESFPVACFWKGSSLVQYIIYIDEDTYISMLYAFQIYTNTNTKENMHKTPITEKGHNNAIHQVIILRYLEPTCWNL